MRVIEVRIIYEDTKYEREGEYMLVSIIRAARQTGTRRDSAESFAGNGETLQGHRKKLSTMTLCIDFFCNYAPYFFFLKPYPNLE